MNVQSSFVTPKQVVVEGLKQVSSSQMPVNNTNLLLNYLRFKESWLNNLIYTKIILHRAVLHKSPNYSFEKLQALVIAISFRLLLLVALASSQELNMLQVVTGFVHDFILA